MSQDAVVDGEDGDDGPDIGWARAIGSGIAVLLVGFFATIYLADALVTNLTSFGRSTRQYISAVVFVVAVLALAWLLRRLQARRLI